MYRVAVVCEGPSDKAILEAVLDHYLDDYVPLHVQPPTANVGGDAGPFGGGWKGVRAWCRQEVGARGGLGAVGIPENSDLLVVQVDADAAGDPDLDCLRPCPPASDTADEVRAKIRGWLRVKQAPTNVVLCVPSVASETWALAALFPGAPDDGAELECRTDVKALLRRLGKHLQPKLVVSQKGELKNHSDGYRRQQGRITAAWSQVMEVCSQAKRFGHELGALVPQ